jgi:hypothetical protein
VSALIGTLSYTLFLAYLESGISVGICGADGLFLWVMASNGLPL